jgi:hypothetical protein
VTFTASCREVALLPACEPQRSEFLSSPGGVGIAVASVSRFEACTFFERQPCDVGVCNVRSVVNLGNKRTEPKAAVF